MTVPISISQRFLLEALASAGQRWLRPKAIFDRLGISNPSRSQRASLSRALRRLVDRGLMERSQNEKHVTLHDLKRGQGYCYTLTHAGRKAAAWAVGRDSLAALRAQVKAITERVEILEKYAPPISTANEKRISTS
jgi:DNA-binding MarR family transcriptional regulator